MSFSDWRTTSWQTAALISFSEVRGSLPSPEPCEETDCDLDLDLDRDPADPSGLPDRDLELLSEGVLDPERDLDLDPDRDLLEPPDWSELPSSP